MNRPPLEVADIVRCAGQSFLERSHKWINGQHEKVLLAITRCRTAALGGHRDQCADCGHTAISYNSCRNRHCPMVRPGRDLLTGGVEVDECYVGGLEEGLPGRLNLDKALIVVAAQEDGPGIGRIRMRQIVDASAASLMPFVQHSVEPGSVIHTDGWLGYLPVESKGYQHEVAFLKGKEKTPSELMPRVHLAISLLKRWLMGTHQGAVSHKHLDYYLDEFTFRFNRRRSKSRGKLFFRLAQQAVAVDPVTRHRIVHPTSAKAKAKPQSVGSWWVKRIPT